jgi:hypothetical protein
MHAAPSWDIVEGSRVGAPNLQHVPWLHGLHAVLDPDDRERTEQAPRIQPFQAHTYHSGGIAVALSGGTATS